MRSLNKTLCTLTAATLIFSSAVMPGTGLNSVIGSGVAQAAAQVEQNLNYTNNFESGTEANLADSGAVKTDTAISGVASYSEMSGKFLAAQQTGNNVFYFSDMPDIADGTVEMKFGIDGGIAEQFCPAVRVKDATHYSLICRDQNGWLWDGYNGAGEVWGSYLNKAEALVPGKIYTFKETFSGDTYEIYLDGRLIYSSTTGNKLPTAAGKIGFRSYFGAKSLNIDSVKVTDMNNNVVYDRNFDNETAPVANIGTVTTNSTYSLKTSIPGFTGRIAKVVNSSGTSQVVDSKSPMVSNGTYSAKLQLGSAYTSAGLLFRYQDESNWSSVSTDSTGNWKLVGKNDGTDVSFDLTSTPQPLGTTPHQVTVDYHGDHYVLSVDGTELYNGTKPGLFSSYGREGVTTAATSLTTLLDDMTVDYDQVDLYTPPKPTKYIRDYTDGVTGTWKNNADGTAYSPAPSITNNTLVFNNFFGEIYDYDSLEIQDGYYTVKFTTSSSTGRVGFYFRYTSPGQPYAMIYYGGGKEWGWQTDSGHYGVLTSNGPTLLPNTEYTVKIKYIGQTVKVFVNDQLAVSGSADFPVVEGKVGLRSWFDAKKITISKLSQEKYTPPAPPTPSALTPITIASDNLSVELDNRFPAIRSYTWTGSEGTDTLQGQSDFLYKVKINGNESFANVISATKIGSDTLKYQLNVPVIDDNTEETLGNVNMDVTFKATSSSVLMNTHINSEPAGYKISTIEFPDQKLVTVSSSNPNAEGASAWITGEWNQFYEEYYTNDSALGDKLVDQDEGSKSRTYGFVSDGKLAATIINDVINQPAKVNMNISVESGTSNKLLSMWNGMWNVRGDVIDDVKFPPKFDLSSEIIITPDKNGDHTADWKDAAIGYRDIWSQDLHPGADEINNYVSYIAMNFNSLTQAPFLRTLDNAKKLYNLYDGFGQLILEKGYQAEGHDDSHPDVAGHFGIRPGGLKDFNTLVDEGLKYNVKVGVHTNIDGQDPDAYYANKDGWTSTASNYDWVDPTYGTDRAKDLSDGELERRYTQLKQEVPNLAMVYDDVYSGAGWHADQFANIIQNKLGFWFATEFSGPMEQNVIWTHWGTDPYYPSQTDGSMIVRFIKNQYQDTFQAPSPTTSLLLRGMLQAGVGTWQGRTDMQSGVNLFYNNNLLTKYMQHFPIMNITYDSAGLEQSVVFSNNVVATLDEYHTSPTNSNIILGTASLKKDGKKIAVYDVKLDKSAGDTGSGQLDVLNQQSQLFMPWDPQNESKIYYWNPKGGSTTWEMPDSWNGLSSVEMYKLTDNGRVWERTLPIVNGQVTIDNTTIGVPYIIYKSKAEEEGSDIQKADEWGYGGSVQDPGFDSAGFDSWQKSSTTNTTASHVTVEHDYNKNNYLRITGTDDADISQTVTGLMPGKTYTASVWVDINNGSGSNKDDQSPSTSNRNVYLQVSNYGGPALTNSIDASRIQNLEEPSKFKDTYFQRLEVDFTADQTGQATITLKADATTTASSKVWFDDVRLWENPGKTEFGSHYFYEDFENVSEGLGPFAFRASSGNQTHLAEKVSDELKAADPDIKQPMTYVIDGLFSLKSNEQDFINRTTSVQEIAATLPSTLKLKPNTTYTIGLKYEASKSGLYQISAKSRSGGPKQSVLLSEATGTGKSNIPDWTFPIIKSTGTANAELTFNTGDYSDYYIALETVRAPGAPTLSATDVVLVLDDFYVDDMSPVNHAPVIDNIDDISITKGQTAGFTVTATDEDADDQVSLSLTSDQLPEGATFDAATGVFEWENAEAGDYVVTVSATDGKDTTSQEVHIHVASVNHEPVIDEISPISIQVGETVSFTVLATDEDGDSITFSGSNLPAGATIDAETGIFEWLNAEEGEYVVTVQATDGTATATSDVEIHVGLTPVNHEPVITISDAVTSVLSGETVSFTATATDADESDEVELSITGELPGDATFDAETGSFEWTNAEEGDYVVTLQATDGKATVTRTVAIHVGDTPPVNHAPVIADIANISVNAGETVSFTATATDEDGDTLTFSAAGLPEGTSINSTTGAYLWQHASAGTYQVTVTATDGTLSSSTEFEIYVNAAPVFGPLSATYSVKKNIDFAFTVSATDADEGDTVTLAAEHMPAGATFNAATGEFKWNKVKEDASVTFAATDGKVTIRKTVAIQVTKENTNPTPPTTETGSIPDPTAVVTAGHVVLKVTPDTSGSAVVTVAGKDLLQAANSQMSSVTVTAAADAAKPVNAVVFSLPAQQVGQLADQQKSLVLDAGLATLSFSAGMWNTVIGDNSKEVKVTVSQADRSVLDEQSKAVIGDHPVYDFTLTVDGVEVSQFKKKEVTIALPYELKTGENPNQVVVYYVSDEGKPEVVKNAKYDANTKTVVFSPQHFSHYAAGLASVQFGDIQTVVWAKDSIIALAARGIVKGVAEASFAPQGNVTRAQFITMLVNALDLDVSGAGAEASFTDVKSGMWYSDAIGVAKQLGIVTGKVDGSFGVNDNITRQDMAVILYRALQLAKPAASGAKFTDMDAISAYAQEAVIAVQEAGLMNGVGDGSFDPSANTTRAQAAVTIYRVLNLI